jgi:filamin
MLIDVLLEPTGRAADRFGGMPLGDFPRFINHSSGLHFKHVKQPLPVASSPFEVSVRAGQISPAQCTASGGGLLSAIAGARASFAIQARDAHTNALSVGGADVAAVLRGADGQQVSALVTDLGTGEYSVSYTVRTSGEYTIAVTIDSTPIHSSPFTSLAVAPADLDAAHCVVRKGLEPLRNLGTVQIEAGGRLVLTIDTADRFGNRRREKAGAITHELRGATAVRSSGVANYVEAGVYSLTLSSSVAGTFQLAILHEGKLIEDGTFTVLVAPAVTSSKQSTFWIESEPILPAGSLSMFAVQTYDHYGNRRAAGGDQLVLRVVGQSEPRVALADRSDGRYDVTTTITQSGQYSVHATLADSPLRGSPILIDVLPGCISAQYSTFVGPSASKARVGVQESFTVATSDEFGNPSMDSTAHVTFKATSINRAQSSTAASSSAAAVAASFGGQCSPSVQQSDQDGAYVCSFVTMKAAWFNISVFIGSAELNGSPFLIEVLPDRSRAARSVAAGAGLSFAEAGVPSAFHIKTRDRFGNDCVEGGDKIQVRIVGARHVEAAVADANNGTYTVQYATTKAGAYSVSVLVNDQVLPGSPFQLQVA